MSSYKTYNCTVTPEDILQVERAFSSGGKSIGLRAICGADGRGVIICLDATDTLSLIKQLKKALKGLA